MLFNKKIKPGEYEIKKEGKEDVMYFNYDKYPHLPSLEEDPLSMARTIDALVQVPSASRIVFNQKRNYDYGYKQTSMLLEVAQIYNHLVKQKKALTYEATGSELAYTKEVAERQKNIQYIILNLLRTDPVSSYVELTRLIREEKIRLTKVTSEQDKFSIKHYLNLLNEIYLLLDKTQLIQSAKPYLAGHLVGSREIYRNLFRPMITPDFMYTRLMSEPPLDGEEIDAYSIDPKTNVNIFATPRDIKPLYHLIPPEFKISEDKYALIDLARNVLSEHQPKAEEFLDPEKMRTNFFNIGRDLLTELAAHRRMNISYDELNELARILVRYTVGFGLIEVLLQDPRVQDITINGPIGETPIFIVHQDHEECVTNIIPSREDGESWASKLRLLSARPLDEANPVLDTELILPGARARVAVITHPLNPLGLAFAIRRHRDKPWTLPLFVQNKMISPLAAGLMSFFIDGARTLFVAGTRASGKTSFLGATLVEIMRKYRIITIEDTLELATDTLRELGYNIQPMKVRSALVKAGAEVSADEGIRTSLRLGDSSLIVGEIRSSIMGNEEVLIVKNGITKRVQIKDLEGKDISNIYTPSMDFDLKFKLRKLIAFVKHPKRKKLLEVTTRTGRKVTVTPDHSLFTSKDFKIVPIECQSLKVGSKIIIPEKLPSGYNDIDSINLLELLEEDCRVTGYEEDLKQIIKKLKWKKASKICDSNDIYQYLRKGVQHTNIPIKSFNKLIIESNKNINMQTMQIKTGTSKTLSAEIKITKDFCRFLGYYVAEGYTPEFQGNVVFSNGDEVIINDIINISRNAFNIEPSVRSTKGLGISTQITLHNKILALLLKKLGCGRIGIEKRIPPIIFSLSEDKICEFLKGYFDGDGSQTSTNSSGNRISCSTISEGLANDLLYLFLQLGIVARVYSRQPKGIGKNKSYIIEFKQRKYVEIFMQKIGFKKYKKQLINRNAPHSNLNTINYDLNILERHVKLKRKYRHLRKFNSCGKEYLKKVVNDSASANNLIKTFAHGEFFLDEVKEIKEINLAEGEYVYDLSVEPCQNFIGGFGGIMLHNTEAFALFEAMRVGALANTVAGTIHGDSPYGVFDRVVNDLQVPRTSFKATDIIVICNPVKSPDGLHKFRRVTQITEVRKEWEQDPLREGGFIDLMKYDTKQDKLVPTDHLLNGDSEIIKAIAGNIRDYAGKWDAVWDNIILRAKMKETMVNYANNLKNNDLLEAKHVITMNDFFHKITDKVKEETGYPDTIRIFNEWEEELKKYIKKNF